MATLNPLAALSLALATGAAGAQVLTFVETGGDEYQVPLGYPVPMPVESQTAVDGFRAYAALRARLADLALTHTSISEQAVGKTARNRDIFAYQISNPGAQTPEGFTKPAALINGGIHAREWASPEVAVALIERFAEHENDGGLYRYLLDNLNLIVLPVLNVDGFLQTQRYPAQALQTEFAGDPQPAQQASQPPQYRNYPRDGRMRRKNMRDTDEILCAAATPGCLADGMNGVDLNRNNQPFFAFDNQGSSGQGGALIYRGPSAASEPEIQALYAAATLAPRSRLRFFVDTHSFSRVYFGVDTGTPRRDAIARTLAGQMSAATGGSNRYPYDPTPPNYGIGSTDEQFGFGEQIPAYTLEIEPRNDSFEYGGFGYHHDGFILPDSQIARVREELTAANTLGLYRMAGPPALLATQIRRAGDGQVQFDARWQRSGAGRALQVDVRQPLAADVDYRLWLGFSKPMRARDSSGTVTQFRGQNVVLAPAIAIEGLDSAGNAFRFDLPTPAAGWRAAGSGAPNGVLRYADDAYALEFRLPPSLPLAGARRVNLRVAVTDFSGQALDTNPVTVVDWAGGWAGYEDEQGSSSTDSGGADRTLRIVDDVGTPPGNGGGGSGGGAAGGLFALLAALLSRLRALRAQRRPGRQWYRPHGKRL